MDAPQLSMEYLKSITDDFDKDNMIGSGGFGDVYTGVDAQQSIQVAVKKFHPDLLTGPSGESVLAQNKREVKVLSQFRHDNIVRVLGYALDDKSDIACLAYEKAEGGSLHSLLEQEKGRKALTWRKRITVAISILSALKYIYSQNCSHRDLKPANICFTGNFDRVLLIDFGLSRLVDAVYTHTCTGVDGFSDPYVAPEFKNREVRFDERCEMYSFSASLLEYSPRLRHRLGQ